MTIYRHHHYTEIGFVAGVEGDKIRLSANADIVVTLAEKQSGSLSIWDDLREAASQAGSLISEEATRSRDQEQRAFLFVSVKHFDGKVLVGGGSYDYSILEPDPALHLHEEIPNTEKLRLNCCVAHRGWSYVADRG